jgi:SAM-dependent methyltransferase
MPPTSPSRHRSIRAPHPLALALIERLRASARVLEIGTGSRRNADALSTSGHRVTSIEIGDLSSVTGSFDAALSTHGLLHGTPPQIARALSNIASLLKPRGSIFATFGSTADRRFGLDDKVDEYTYAERAGDEKGIPHAYFDADRLRELLAPKFEIEMMQEQPVDNIAGTWAHPNEPLRDAVHWFVIAIRRD